MNEEEQEIVQKNQSDVEIDFNIFSNSNNVTIRKDKDSEQDNQTYSKSLRFPDGFVPIEKKRQRLLSVFFF